MSFAGFSSIRRPRACPRVRSWAASGAVGFARCPSTTSGSNVTTDFFLYTTPELSVAACSRIAAARFRSGSASAERPCFS